MGLGRLATQFQAGGRSPVGAEKILAERSRDEQVADLQHLGETSLVCRSKYHPPAARPSSSWESSRHLPYVGAESGCCFFSHSRGGWVMRYLQICIVIPGTRVFGFVLLVFEKNDLQIKFLEENGVSRMTTPVPVRQRIVY